MIDQEIEPPGAIVLFLGEAGDLPPPAEAARTVVAAHLCHPHAILTLAIGGFDDDPREVCDIPEAKAFYAGLAAALAEYPCAESLTKALDLASTAVLALCAGWLPRDEVVF
jgi:hypothetical protein